MTDPASELSSDQAATLHHYVDLLLDINTRINLISRKDTGEVYDRHVRHSLAIATKDFPDGCTVVDWGTGGGLPAIPLAIRFPDITVVAVDSIGKKTRAVSEMAEKLALTNLVVWNGRAEEWRGKAHYSVSRATAKLAKLWRWHKRIRIPIEAPPECWAGGLICLKGGDLSAEIAALEQVDSRVQVEMRSLADVAPGFPDKQLLHVGAIR
ncbi:MAG: 16S rRNA (guanine(527)-N(7))-methyltransferase RsmG [Rhodothermales bacterium]|nr:16S rRNA (guanine(527)-N(7))-methyltransferase RsmG [Rhodothermales bacterium]